MSWKSLLLMLVLNPFTWMATVMILATIGTLETIELPAELIIMDMLMVGVATVSSLVLTRDPHSLDR